MQEKIGVIVLYLVCFVLAGIFLMSIVGNALHPPASIFGWIRVLVKVFGVYCVYSVARFRDSSSAGNLRLLALIFGIVSIGQWFFLNRTLGVLIDDPEMVAGPVGGLIQFVLNQLLVLGCVYLFCAIALWLPAVQREMSS